MHPLPRLPDWRQTDSMMRAMRGAAEFAPMLAALDRDTSGQEAAGGPSPEEIANLDAAMLAPVTGGRDNKHLRLVAVGEKG
jgi:hypothetical protein